MWVCREAKEREREKRGKWQCRMKEIVRAQMNTDRKKCAQIKCRYCSTFAIWNGQVKTAYASLAIFIKKSIKLSKTLYGKLNLSYPAWFTHIQIVGKCKSANSTISIAHWQRHCLSSDINIMCAHLCFAMPIKLWPNRQFIAAHRSNGISVFRVIIIAAAHDHSVTFLLLFA